MIDWFNCLFFYDCYYNSNLDTNFVQTINVNHCMSQTRFFPFVAEYAKRFAIFQENLVKARKMQDMDRGSAKYGVTVFSDLTGKPLCGL